MSTDTTSGKLLHFPSWRSSKYLKEVVYDALSKISSKIEYEFSLNCFARPFSTHFAMPIYSLFPVLFARTNLSNECFLFYKNAVQCSINPRF